MLLHHSWILSTCTTAENQTTEHGRAQYLRKEANFYIFKLCLFIHSFPFLAVSICSTSQRGVAWALQMTGERGRTSPLRSERRGLSTAKTATASVSNPWRSTWPASTFWRANEPGSNHLLCPLLSLRAAHNQPHLSWRTCNAGIT